MSWSTTLNDYLVETQIAWIIPGKNKIKQSTTLIIRSLPKPLFQNTATGGNKIAKIINTTLFIFYSLLIGMFELKEFVKN